MSVIATGCGLPLLRAAACERSEMRWRRPRTVELIAAACALLATGSVLLAFSRLKSVASRWGAQPELIATVDLRLGNPVVAAERGQAQARKDIEAQLLQFQTFAPVPPQSPDDAARARQWKQRYGVVWVRKGGASTSVSQAYVAGYNRVMRAEIERRYGRRVAEELTPPPACAGSAGGCP